jgi:hypothetical protein
LCQRLFSVGRIAGGDPTWSGLSRAGGVVRFGGWADVQPDLLSRAPVFDSGVELAKADHLRLGKQIARVLSVLSDGRWYTVPELQDEIFGRFNVRDPEPSLSAQIRNLKKQKHGGHDIRRIRVGNVYKFRLVV